MSLFCKSAELNCVHRVANSPLVLRHEGVESIKAGHRIQQQQRGSEVAEWLAHWLLVLEVPGSIPTARKICWSEHASLRVICRNDMTQCAVFWIGTLTGGPPVQGQSSLVQVKDPYTGSILMHVGSSCKQTVVYNVHLPRIIRN